MAIVLIQIDKSGSDILEKDYSIVLVKNKMHVFGTNIPQKIKDMLTTSFNNAELGVSAKSHKAAKLRFKLRLHTSIVILLIKEALKNSEDDISIQICNDFDGHFHEIKNMVYDHICKISKIKREDILQTKFPKPSFIDTAGRNIRNKKYRDYSIIKLNVDTLKEMIRK